MPVQKQLAEKALTLKQTAAPPVPQDCPQDYPPAPQFHPQAPPQKRGRSVDEFAELYGIGRSSVYEEIRAGRLKARKCGKRTIIADEDGESWFAQLPRVKSAAAAA